jgi:hypothetical protein
MKRAVLLCGALVLGVADSVHAQVFSDDTFSDGDWQVHLVTLGIGGSVTGTQETAVGNPAPSRRVEDVVNAGSGGNRGAWGFHLRSGASYTPSAQGSISCIDFSLDFANLTACEIGGDGQAFGPCIRQGGELYAIYGLTLTSTSWQTRLETGAQSSTFQRFDPLTALFEPASHPDFSSSGGLMELGFFTANSAPGSGYTRCVEYDNWSFVLHAEDTMPPTLSCPLAVLVVDSKGGTPGDVVFFVVAATDNTDPSPSVVCVPPPGSFFPRGTTSVTCTATDACGNRSVCTFPVIVQPTVRTR